MAKPQVQIFPIVCLNGTSREELMEQAHNAADKISAAIKACLRMAPHGRDYQLSPKGDFELACRQNDARIDRLLDVRQEISTLIHSLYEGQFK